MRLCASGDLARRRLQEMRRQASRKYYEDSAAKVQDCPPRRRDVQPPPSPAHRPQSSVCLGIEVCRADQLPGLRPHVGAREFCALATVSMTGVMQPFVAIGADHHLMGPVASKSRGWSPTRWPRCASQSSDSDEHRRWHTSDVVSCEMCHSAAGAPAVGAGFWPARRRGGSSHEPATRWKFSTRLCWEMCALHYGTLASRIRSCFVLMRTHLALTCAATFPVAPLASSAPPFAAAESKTTSTRARSESLLPFRHVFSSCPRPLARFPHLPSFCFNRTRLTCLALPHPSPSTWMGPQVFSRVHPPLLNHSSMTSPIRNFRRARSYHLRELTHSFVWRVFTRCDPGSGPLLERPIPSPFYKAIWPKRPTSRWRPPRPLSTAVAMYHGSPVGDHGSTSQCVSSIEGVLWTPGSRGRFG